MGERNVDDNDGQSSNRVTDDWIDITRSSYTFVKYRLLAFIGKIEDLIFRDVLDFEELLPAITAPTDHDKIDCLLRTIIRKGDKACEKFVSCLRDEQILKLYELKESRTKSLPEEALQEFNWLRTGIFRHHYVQQYMIREVEINDIVDILYEWHLINVDQHESILKVVERKVKVAKLVSILDAKIDVNDVNWFIKFCYILKEQKHERVIIWLRNYTSPSQLQNELSEQDPVDDLDISFGCNIKVTTTEETERSLEQHHINDMNNQLPENCPVGDVRSGCVEFILFSSYAKLPNGSQRDFCLQFLQNLLRLPNVKATLKPGQTFKVMLRGGCLNIPLLDNNGQTITSLKDDVALKLCRLEILQQMNVSETLGYLQEMELINGITSGKLQQITDEKLKKEYIFHVLATLNIANLREVMLKLKESKYCKYISDYVEEKKCLECYRYSIWQSKKEVMDEIDTQMMKTTFQDRPQQIPKFILECCIERSNITSRTDRAKLFLDFVLIKGQLLVAFAEVFTQRSKLCIKHVKCDTCKKNGIESLVKYEEEKKADFEFIIDDNEELVVGNQTTYPLSKEIETETTGAKPKELIALANPVVHKSISMTKGTYASEEDIQELLATFKDFLTKSTDKAEIKAFTEKLLSNMDVGHVSKIEPVRHAEELYLSTVIELQNHINNLEEENKRNKFEPKMIEGTKDK